MSTTIGIDIGGSSITAVARDASAEILGRYDSGGPFAGGRQIASSAVTAIRALEVSDVTGIGVGVPGQVDPVSGQVSMAVNLGIGADAFPLAAAIESEVGVPVYIENDVKTAALGAHETLARAGRPAGSIVVVSIGTGISAGVVVDGSIVRGATGMAGEIGHVVVDESGPLCRCGQRGCLEAVAAGPAIGRVWPKGPDGEAAGALFGAVASGDPAAVKVADRVVGHVTTALIWLAAAYDAEVMVLAGGVASVGEEFLAVVHRHIVERGAVSELAARRLRPETVVLADTYDPPGPRGAALLAAQNSLQQRVSPAGKQASNDI